MIISLISYYYCDHINNRFHHYCYYMFSLSFLLLPLSWLPTPLRLFLWISSLSIALEILPAPSPAVLPFPPQVLHKGRAPVPAGGMRRGVQANAPVPRGRVRHLRQNPLRPPQDLRHRQPLAPGGFGLLLCYYYYGNYMLIATFEEFSFPFVKSILILMILTTEK